jgi:hypothetical protein
MSANYLADAAEPAIEFALMPANVSIVATRTTTSTVSRSTSSVSLWGDLHTVVKYDPGGRAPLGPVLAGLRERLPRLRLLQHR